MHNNYYYIREIYTSSPYPKRYAVIEVDVSRQTEEHVAEFPTYQGAEADARRRALKINGYETGDCFD